MKELSKAWMIYSNHLPGLYKHWSVITSTGLMIIFTIFTKLGEQGFSVYLFSIPVQEVLSGSTEALKSTFFDYYMVIWALICFGLVPAKILVPVAQSYTVSSSLWLRLSPAKSLTLSLYRGMLILMPAIFFTLFGFLSVMVFATAQGIPISSILYPIYTITAFILFTGALCMLFKGRPTTSIELRYAFVFVALVTPVFLYLLRDRLVYRLNGYYPHVFPYRAEELGVSTLPGTFTAIAIGLAILTIIVLYEFYSIFSYKYRNL